MGYRQPYAEAVLRFLASRGFLIIDIRERAGSRFNKMYNRARLEDRFPGMYHRVPELGNVNHNELGAQIEFKDLEAGMKESQRIIMEDAAGTGVIYLCACETWPTCHRSQAAIHLQERIAGLTVIHLEADGTFQLAETSRAENVETMFCEK